MNMAMKFAALGIVAAVLSVAIRKQVPELSALLIVCAGLVIVSSCAEALHSAIGFIDKLNDISGIAPEITLPVVKVAGIAVVTRLSGDFCRDVNESSLASTVELGGILVSLLTIVPLISAVLDLLFGLLKGI